MRTREIVAAAAGAVVATVLAGSVAWAAIPGSGEVYTACVLKNVGTVRLIDKSLPPSNLMSKCTALEVEISWNRAGQPGAPGQAGLAGEDGIDGQNGVSGYEVVEANASIAPGATETIVVTCPAGKAVLQGTWARGSLLTAIDEFYTFTGPPLVSGSYHVTVAKEAGDRFPTNVTAVASCIGA